RHRVPCTVVSGRLLKEWLAPGTIHVLSALGGAWLPLAARATKLIVAFRHVLNLPAFGAARVLIAARAAKLLLLLEHHLLLLLALLLGHHLALLLCVLI